MPNIMLGNKEFTLFPSEGLTLVVNVKVDCLCRGLGNYERRLATALKDRGYEGVTEGESVLFNAMKAYVGVEM